MALVLNVDADEPIFLQPIVGCDRGPVALSEAIRVRIIGKNGRRFRVAIDAPANVVIDLQPPDGVQVRPQLGVKP